MRLERFIDRGVSFTNVLILMVYLSCTVCFLQGKVPLLSLEATHQLHIFIFVLAITHVIFSVTTMLLGGAQVCSFWHALQFKSRNLSNFCCLFLTVFNSSDTPMETVGEWNSERERDSWKWCQDLACCSYFIAVPHLHSK
jgi:hypothetical protein